MPIGLPYVREAGKRHELGTRLMAVVAEGERGRLFINPDARQVEAATVDKPSGYPSGSLAGKAQVNIGLYGLNETADLFTNRQLVALTTFSSLVKEAQEKAYEDAVAAGMADDGIGLDAGGAGARAYGEAVGVYLAFLVDQLANHSSSICSWHSRNTQLRNVFSRQAIPMTWDYAESNPFCHSSGSYANLFDRAIEAFLGLPQKVDAAGTARQWDAQSDNGLRNIMVSTDPPYYDNIGYADLSDYFYVWLRQSLKGTYPKLFGTMLVPKAEELVATPYRFGGSKQRAKDFFENGMLRAFKQVYDYAREDIPVTIYYAFKQSETEQKSEGEKTASSGWETILAAIIKAGFSITGTWPIRTEMGTRMIGNGANALASSIVLVCRKRSSDAPICTRRELVTALRRELRPALDNLQAANIAPVDLAQSAIGPGIGVYSRYSHVLDADGSEMGVRAALQLINEELDAYFNEQSEGTDSESRFCIELYKQAGFNDVKYGEAEVLATAKNVSIQAMEHAGLLDADKGVVHLLVRDKIFMVSSPQTPTWLLAQQLTQAIDDKGIEGCAQQVVDASIASAERAKALAYRLFTIADRKGWASEAYAYNALVTSWADVLLRATELYRSAPVQMSLDI